MNIFKSFTMKWWQVGLFKLALASFGIILGVYFQEFFLEWIVLVAVIFALSTLYISKIWWKQ